MIEISENICIIFEVGNDILSKKVCALLSAILIVSVCVGCSGKSASSSKSTSAYSNSLSSDELTQQSSADSLAESVTEPSTVSDIKPAVGKYVYDDAGVMSADGYNECNNYAEVLYEKYLINVAVVTVKSLNGMTAKEYAESAYTKIYENKGSGLLILINNDGGEDIVLRKGNCQNYISDENIKNAMYYETQKIVKDNDYGSAVMQLLKLGETCPLYVFDNAAIFTLEQAANLEALCKDSTVSVLATSNSTGKTNQDVAKEYYTRHYVKASGTLILLDNVTNTFTIIKDGQPLAADLTAANAQAAASNYFAATQTLITSLKS